MLNLFQHPFRSRTADGESDPEQVQGDDLVVGGDGLEPPTLSV
jgi:hypothetical protein